MNMLNCVTGEENVDTTRVCLSRRGYAGIVPTITQVGDLVCIFHGSSMPFILRKNEERERLYRLIGKRYINGMMHEEPLSFKGVEELNVPRAFILRDRNVIGSLLQYYTGQISRSRVTNTVVVGSYVFVQGSTKLYFV